MKALVYLIIPLILVACSGEKATQEVPKEESAPLVTLTSQQMEYNGIETGKLPKGVVYHKVKATGKVDVPPNFALTLSSPVSAYVVSLKVLPGNVVNKGAVVAQLRSPAIAQVQKDYLAAVSEYNYMKKSLERKGGLLEGNTVSAREYEQLESDLEVKAAQLGYLQSELMRLGIAPESVKEDQITQYLTVRAPIAGMITESYKQTGEHVGAEEALVKILNHEHEHVELQVFQEDLSEIKNGMNVWLKVPGDSRTYDASVFLVNSELDPVSLAANVHVHPHESFPDLAINAVVFGEVIYQVDSGYVLPKSEVMRQGNSHFIFVKQPNGYERVEVQTGYDDGTNILIKGPLNILQQEVVIHGNYYLNGAI